MGEVEKSLLLAPSYFAGISETDEDVPVKDGRITIEGFIAAGQSSENQAEAVSGYHHACTQLETSL